MRLCLIYHVWDDWDLQMHSSFIHRELNDGVIVIYSETSNFGEWSPIPDMEVVGNVIFFKHEPDLSLPPHVNERNKRNFGLQKARELGYTHFLNMDGDEFYDPAEFLKEKERFLNTDLAGTVCRVKTYFKDPCLTIGYDTTLVPFIHKITPDLKFEWNPHYPFAFEGPKREIRIDPTRQMNINSGVEWSEITMNHFSWVRPDIHKKIRNSTARANLEQSSVVEDFALAKPGYFCQLYGKVLEPCSDPFNLCSLPFIIEQRRSSTGSQPAQDKKI